MTRFQKSEVIQMTRWKISKTEVPKSPLSLKAKQSKSLLNVKAAVPMRPMKLKAVQSKCLTSWKAAVLMRSLK